MLLKLMIILVTKWKKACKTAPMGAENEAELESSFSWVRHTKRSTRYSERAIQDDEDDADFGMQSADEAPANFGRIVHNADLFPTDNDVRRWK